MNFNNTILPLTEQEFLDLTNNDFILEYESFCVTRHIKAVFLLDNRRLHNKTYSLIISEPNTQKEYTNYFGFIEAGNKTIDLKKLIQFIQVPSNSEYKNKTFNVVRSIPIFNHKEHNINPAISRESALAEIGYDINQCEIIKCY